MANLTRSLPQLSLTELRLAELQNQFSLAPDDDFFTNDIVIFIKRVETSVGAWSFDRVTFRGKGEVETVGGPTVGVETFDDPIVSVGPLDNITNVDRIQGWYLKYRR